MLKGIKFKQPTKKIETYVERIEIDELLSGSEESYKPQSNNVN